MTIASDFYSFLDEELGDGAVEPGTWGRELHNRIAELEERHAELRKNYDLKAAMLRNLTEGPRVSLDGIKKEFLG